MSDKCINFVVKKFCRDNYSRQKLLVKKNKIMIVSEKPISYNKIKALTGEVWVLISDPEYSEKDGNLKSGVLVYFSKNKEDVQNYILKDKSGLIGHYTIIYTGKQPSDQVFVL